VFPDPFDNLEIFADLFDFFYFLVIIIVGTGCTSGLAADHIAKLDARFMAMLSSLGCHENTMARQ
jgi:hypothetical protein